MTWTHAVAHKLIGYPSFAKTWVHIVVRQRKWICHELAGGSQNHKCEHQHKFAPPWEEVDPPVTRRVNVWEHNFTMKFLRCKHTPRRNHPCPYPA